MQTVGIKALQTNPGVLSKALDSGDYLLITRRGKPFGIAAAFDDSLLDLGFRKWIAVRSFQAGDLSLGQVAQVFEKPKEETMRLLSELGIPIADYDLAEDLETLDLLGGN
jgi:predicted HTH domain antitoxin